MNGLRGLSKPELTLKAVRTRNQRQHAAADWISNEPAFVRIVQVLGSGPDRGLDPVAARAGDPEGGLRS